MKILAMEAEVPGADWGGADALLKRGSARMSTTLYL